MEDLPAIIRARGCTRVLLVTDPGVMALTRMDRAPEIWVIVLRPCAAQPLTASSTWSSFTDSPPAPLSASGRPG